jgi:glycosyltransferase involved in cell wall biosynthesis
LHRNSPHFQHQVADIASNQAEALVCYDRFAYHAFKRLSNGQVKRILDLSFVHPISARRILAEEAERWPELAPSLGLSGVTGAGFDHIIDEAAMADYILVGSTFAQNSCIENGIRPDSVFVIPYGVNDYRFLPTVKEPEKHEDTFRFLFVGQIGQRKGIRYLLDAFERLGLVDAELWLCGNIMDVEHILDTMPRGCRYLGYVPNKQLPAIFSQVDAFVFPSILEGFGLVILEAMACGLPVITTSHTGGPDIIDDGVEGFIIPPGDADALAETMLHLYEHPVERIEMGTAARQAAEKRSWSAYHEQAAHLFERILGDSVSS